MITTEQALKIILDSVKPSAEVEWPPLAEALGATLAQDALSDIDIPPFHRVTVDGYAVIASDGPGQYPVVEDVPAGHYPKVMIRPGEVSKVMTGAPLPEGADAVIAVEKTGGFADVGRMARIDEPISQGKNISRQGEDLKAGQTALARGAVIGPAQAAVLASVGVDPCPIFRRPRVAVLATGDELVDCQRKPGPGQIRNSNGPSTMALIKSAGVTGVNLGTAGDSEAALEEKIRQGMESDFLIVSGGVSAGDRDLVPAVLARCGYRTLFHKVAVKPGKPTLFGVSAAGRHVFGLPGNPVSSMVIFELFILPALMRFQGAPHQAMAVEARLEASFKRKDAQRQEYLPVRMSWEEGGFLARTIDYHGSGHFIALTQANGLIMIPMGVTSLPKGSVVSARFTLGRIAPAQ
ncbi:MAG: molybdopterin molybdotransferase MoeA [Nitrospinota bacterium]|nr:molybdopterin molybdotransferase MoeA [Nitrospinota bacterium]